MLFEYWIDSELASNPPPRVGGTGLAIPTKRAGYPPGPCVRLNWPILSRMQIDQSHLSI